MSKILGDKPVYSYRNWDVYQTYDEDETLSDQLVIKNGNRSFVFMSPVTNSISKTVKDVKGMIDREIEKPGKYSGITGYTLKIN